MRVVVALALLVIASGVRAQADPLPVSLISDTLTEPQPTAYAPADLSHEDYSVTRSLDGDASVQAHIEEGSLEWVRTAKYLVLPRAVVRVEARGLRHGVVHYAGVVHAMAIEGDEASVDVPVALFAGAAHPLIVTGLRDGAPVQARFTLRFAPRPEHRGTVLFDSSCSPHELGVHEGSIPDDSLLYVGCSAVVTRRDDRDSRTLELYLLWDQAGEVSIQGVRARPSHDVLYRQRVTGRSGTTTLSAAGRRVVLAYSVPDPIHAGFLGVGIGPYYYRTEYDRRTVESGIQLMTLYAAYTVDPTTRFVYFNAVALHPHGSVDQGLYLWLEQMRIFDDRVSLNLLLGANVLTYRRHDEVEVRLGFPQGIELSVRDFLARNHNLMLGAFIYPPIRGRSYYNAWLRWGTPRLFGEINWIEWQEPHASGNSTSRAVGLSVGMPLFGFLGYL